MNARVQVPWTTRRSGASRTRSASLLPTARTWKCEALRRPRRLRAIWVLTHGAQGAPPVLVLDLHAARATERLTEFIASNGAAFASKVRSGTAALRFCILSVCCELSASV